MPASVFIIADCSNRPDFMTRTLAKVTMNVNDTLKLSVLVLKESLRTNLKSWSRFWSLEFKSLSSSFVANKVLSLLDTLVLVLVLEEKSLVVSLFLVFFRSIYKVVFCETCFQTHM